MSIGPDNGLAHWIYSGKHIFSPKYSHFTHHSVAHLWEWVMGYLLWFHMMTSSNGNVFRVTGPLCGEFTGPSDFPTQRPVTRSFDVFFDLRLNKPLSKQSWGWWFQTLSHSLWRHRNECVVYVLYFPLWRCVQYVVDLGWVKSDITAPSHYLNKCWLIIEGVLWHLHESIIARSGQDIDPSMILKIILFRLP